MDSTFPEDDERHGADLHAQGPAERLRKVAELSRRFAAKDRSPAQAAIGWNLAMSERTIPIPGFKSVAQVEDNAGTIALGPLTPAEVAEVAAIVSGSSPG